MAVDAAVWCRLQLAVVGAHINAAAPLVAIYGLPKALSMTAVIALLHGASARYLIHAAAESADSYGAVAASCGLGRRRRAMSDGAALVVVASACAKRLGSAAGALAGVIEGPSYLVNVCAALGLGLTQCTNQIIAARLIALRTGLAAAALDKSARVATTAAVLGLLGLLAIIVLGVQATDVAVETAHPLKALASLNVAFATLQPASLSLVLRRALAGGDPDALASAAVAAALTTGALYAVVAVSGNSPSDTLPSAAVAALSLVPLVPPLRHAVEGVAEGLALRTRSRALAALAVAVVFLLASAVPDDVWAAVVALGVGLTSFALPVWCHWRVERPRGDPRQLCKSLRFVLLEIVLPAVVLFLGVALSVLPAAGLVARAVLGVVPREQSRLVER